MSVTLLCYFIEITLQHGCSPVSCISSEHLFLRTALEGCFCTFPLLQPFQPWTCTFSGLTVCSALHAITCFFNLAFRKKKSIVVHRNYPRVLSCPHQWILQKEFLIIIDIYFWWISENGQNENHLLTL